MRVDRWMSPDPNTLEPSDTLIDARKQMTYYGVHHFPVTRDGRLVGIISDRDLYGTGHPPGTEVAQFMTPDPTTVYEEDSIREAARLMLDQRISSLPVINYAKELVGLLTTTDCLLAVIDMDTDEDDEG